MNCILITVFLVFAADRFPADYEPVGLFLFDRRHGCISGHYALRIHLDVPFESDFPHNIVRERSLAAELSEEVINLRLGCGEPPDGTFNRIRLDSFAVLEIYGKIDIVMGLHEVFIRPDLLHSQAPALLVADPDLRILVDLHGSCDRSRAIIDGRDCISPHISVFQAQCVSLGDLTGPLFHYVLRADDQVPDFDRVVGRDLGDRAVDRRRESGGHFLLLSQRIVVRLTQRFKFLGRFVKSAVVSVRILHVVVIHVCQRKVARVLVLISQIETEREEGGIIRIVQPVDAVHVVQPFGEGKSPHRSVLDVVVKIHLGPLFHGSPAGRVIKPVRIARRRT